MPRTKTTETRTPRQRLYLLVTEGRDHGYYHLYGRVVAQRYDQTVGGYVLGGYVPQGVEDAYTDGTLYSGLQLRCQGDDESRERALTGQRDAPVYGYDCEYVEVHRVGRRTAVRMAKTLTTLDAKLDKLTEQRGYVRTYGEYVGRVAEALGCVGIGFERSARSQDVTGQRWRWDNIGAGVSRIDRLIAAWVDEARPMAEPPAEAPDPKIGTRVRTKIAGEDDDDGTVRLIPVGTIGTVKAFDGELYDIAWDNGGWTRWTADELARDAEQERS